MDAKSLLDAGRWACAYYVAGYALECALKSCVLTYVEKSGIIFDDPKFLAGCRTHKLEDLLKLANLQAAHGVAVGAKPVLLGNWSAATNWTEESRYEQRSKKDAEELYEAITNNPDGVLPWIKLHW
ncbi:MAG: hypothetical protein ACYC3I_03100 [Gemmataceae bacterium]